MLKIIVDAGDISLYQETVAGTIYLLLDNVYFPFKDWSDLVVPVLGMWTSEIVDLLHGKTDRAECFFMDGSYYFEVLPEKERTVIVNACELSTGLEDRRVIFTVRDTLDQLAKKLIQALENLQAALKIKSPDNDYHTAAFIEELKEALPGRP